MSKIRFEFNQVPISTQHCYGNRVMGKRVIRYMSAKGKKYKEDLREAIKQQVKELPLWKDKVEVKLWLYFKDKRRRDIDNYNKIILDSMEGLIYEDDKQIRLLQIYKVESDVGKIVVEVKTR